MPEALILHGFAPLKQANCRKPARGCLMIGRGETEFRDKCVPKLEFGHEGTGIEHEHEQEHEQEQEQEQEWMIGRGGSRHFPLFFWRSLLTMRADTAKPFRFSGRV